MDTKFYVIAQAQLDQSIKKVEAERGKKVTPAARLMLEAIVMESMTTRESEWRTRAGLLFESYGSDRQLSGHISESLGKVFHQAYLDQSGEFITTRDILSAIHKNWCGVFPIC